MSNARPAATLCRQSLSWACPVCGCSCRVAMAHSVACWLIKNRVECKERSGYEHAASAICYFQLPPPSLSACLSLSFCSVLFCWQRTLRTIEIETYYVNDARTSCHKNKVQRAAGVSSVQCHQLRGKVSFS